MVGKGAKEIIDYFLYFATILFCLMKPVKSFIRGQKVVLAGSPNKPRSFVLSDSTPMLGFRARRGSDSAVIIECSARKKNACRMLEVDLEPGSALAIVFIWRGKPSVNIAQKFWVGQGAKLHLLNITRGSQAQVVSGSYVHSGRIDRTHATDRIDVSFRRKISSGRNGKEIDIHGVSEDHAKIVCNGAVEIGPKGSGTHAHLIENSARSTARAAAILHQCRHV